MSRDKEPPTLADLGENILVSQLIAQLPTNAHLLVGAGDDCAVVARDDMWDSLLKTDVVVQGVHFLAQEQPERIGRKALARAVSDIAAMGGIPEHALITLLAHPQTPVETIYGIYRGLRDHAQEWNISIAGGETSSLPQEGIIINVALIGRIEKGTARLRSQAQEGDIIFVTGELGNSFASQHHLNFCPRIEQGRFLREGDYAHAMMDLSDGLSTDLPRLAQQSKVSFNIFLEKLPLRTGSSITQALSEGEDYELLFTVSPTRTECLKQQWATLFPQLPLTAIGTIISPRDPPPLLHAKGQGWEHFSPNFP